MIRLKYRQGSFAREEEHATECDAAARAHHLMRAGTGCSCFQIVDQLDNVLRGGLEVQNAFARQTYGSAVSGLDGR